LGKSVHPDLTHRNKDERELPRNNYACGVKTLKYVGFFLGANTSWGEKNRRLEDLSKGTGYISAGRGRRTAAKLWITTGSVPPGTVERVRTTGIEENRRGNGRNTNLTKSKWSTGAKIPRAS